MISPKPTIKCRKPSGKVQICLIATLLFLLYLFSNLYGYLGDVVQEKELEVFTGTQRNKEYNAICFEKKFEPSFGELPHNLDVWRQVGNRECRYLFQKFTAMYSLEVQAATLKIGPELERKVKSWLGNNDKLYEEAQAQRIFTLHDHYNHRFTVYNAVRGKRPTTGSHNPNKMFISEPTSAEKSNCDFCHPITMTGEDTFGRIHGKYSVSAANIFKVSKWHGLFLTKRHTLFNITEVEFVDLFNTGLKWFKSVNEVDHGARYPVVFWDMFPHAGASQMHVHVHGIIAKDNYPGQFGDLFSVTKDFRSKENSYYWTSVIRIHEALGLLIRYKKAIALAPLVPHRSHELWLIALEPCKELFQLLYYTIRMYQDGLSQYCFSMGGAFPVADAEQFDPKESLPVVIQIGTRGDCSSSVNDVSSLELFLFNNVNTDPYLTISKLQHFVEMLSSNGQSVEEDVINYFKPFNMNQ